MKRLISLILIAGLIVSCLVFAGCDDPKDDLVVGDNNIEADDIFGAADDTTAAVADTTETVADTTEAAADTEVE